MTSDTKMQREKFMQDPYEIRVDEESKLMLHSLLRYHVKRPEKEENRKLNDLLDALELIQVTISGRRRAVPPPWTRPWWIAISRTLRILWPEPGGPYHALQAVQGVPKAEHVLTS